MVKVATEEQQALWKEEFRLADTTNRGYLLPDEVKELFRKHMSVSQRYFQKSSFRKMDKDGDGKIDCDEYCALRNKFSCLQIGFPASSCCKKEEEEAKEPEVVVAAEPMESVFEKIAKLTKGNLQSPDENLARQAALDLESLLTSKDTFTFFAGLGGHLLLVTLMKTWRAHVSVAKSLVYLMNQFFYHYGPEDKKIIESIVSAGCLEVVVDIFFHLKSDVDIARHSMFAVGNLIWAAEDSYKKIINRFVMHNGIALVKGAMNDFPKDQRVQNAGCFLVNQLTYGGINDQILTAAVLAAVGKALISFPDDDKIKERASHIFESV